jgi:hypothetical protein
MALTGARGQSEYIARSAKFNGSTSALNDTTTTLVDGKQSSFIFTFNSSATSGNDVFVGMSNANSTYAEVIRVSIVGTTLYIKFNKSGGAAVLNMTYNLGTVTLGVDYLVMCSFDQALNLHNLYIDGVLVSPSITTNLNENILFSTATDTNIGAYIYGLGLATDLYAGDMSSIYFTTDYIDFSQEANRNLFVNQLGYPRDLTPLIADATIPTPLIYLPFDDTSNLGKNLGTGGDFTVVGTVTAGADFAI